MICHLKECNNPASSTISTQKSENPSTPISTYYFCKEHNNFRFVPNMH